MKLGTIIKLAGMSITSFLTFLVVSPYYASASVNDALTRVGINPNGDFNNSGVYEDLTSMVYFVMALGAFWIVFCLIWGGMTLAGSGGNPQKRTEGFIKLALVAVGGWIILKSYDIAGWIAGLGTAFIM
ncbi:hypothetical protein M3936_19215 [Sutcliffiella horikoshii]|uniref:hypothetical protein n=1 Tax=Sutcliffiella horikoshii TaxID=79883 RepID=UPI00203C9A06|nr:hypothetical protein [Sutcliffiella horikoshii]MCM3619703.1 hypothetical protein [Sutcliffiella horikoshii]